jgi:hypothetical protein
VGLKKGYIEESEENYPNMFFERIIYFEILVDSN